MTGTIALYTPNGHPWPGGEISHFETTDVRALGALHAWGDFVTRYLVRLADSRVVFVKVGAQSATEQTWLKSLGRALSKELRQKRLDGTRLAWPSRDLSFVVHWKEIAS